MNIFYRFFLSMSIIVLLTGCGGDKSNQQDIVDLVSTSLTQTAAAKPAASPTPALVNGAISGKVGLMAPPTPAMVIYAVDPATNKWVSVDIAPNNNGMADFSLNVPPGSYQIFAAVKDSTAVSAGYSVDGKGLTLVPVAANQTASGMMVQVPGNGDCGLAFGIPASPDGKFKALTGPDPACVAGQQTAASTTAPIRVQFQANTFNWSTTGTIQPGGHVSYVLYALKDQTMQVYSTFTPNSGAYFYVRSADGVILAPNATTNWSGALPANQDYTVGIDNNTQQAVQFKLDILIPPAGWAPKAVEPTSDNSINLYSAVSSAVCTTVQGLASDATKISYVMNSSAAFTDPVSGVGGFSCNLSAMVNGSQVSDSNTVLSALVKAMQGWDEQIAYQAGGPTGVSTGLKRQSGLMLISVNWSPAQGVTCPNDQPISSCDLKPEQKIYTILIQVAQQ